MNETIQQFLAGHNVNAPFDILINGELYQCEQVQRFLPGRRLVVKAWHNEVPLLLKLFVPNKKGWRELAREQHGYRLCRESGIAVPEEKLISDNFAGCLAVAYAFLNNARPFILTTDNHGRQVPALLKLIVACHQAGIYQQDLHIDNILMTADGLFLIDLASVTGQPGQPLNKKKSLKNLALLVAQFIPDQQRFILEKLSLYYQGRNWIYDQAERTAFRAILEKTWHKRKENYLSKCFRPCTMTAYYRDRQLEYAFKRLFFKRMGKQVIKNIDHEIKRGEVIKDGNSATVVVTELGGRRVVIKRYNIKSPWHFLKRCWRPSRAANAWRHGNLMELLGIATPEVLGFIERRWGPFRKQAYLISDYVDNAQELSKVYTEEAPSEAELKQIRHIFSLMHAYRLSHGDMKASNLLLTGSGQVELIDLDAMREHRHDWTFKRAFGRDQRRLLKNWPAIAEQEKLKKFII